MTNGAGIPRAEGPYGPHSSVTLLAFARVVAAEVPPRLVRRLVQRLEELQQIAQLEAADRKRSQDARHDSEILATVYTRAAGALHRAEIERATRGRP